MGLRVAVLAVAVLVGCGRAGVGEAGPVGPAGPMGTVGPQGPAGRDATSSGRLIVKDFAGNVVALASTPTVVDSNGDVWTLDWETAAPILEERSIYYTQPDCSGTAYVKPPPPRVPFYFVFPGHTTHILGVRPDFVTLADAPVTSLSTAGVCQNIAQTTLPLVSLAVAEPQQSIVPPSFVGPLHIERMP